MKTIILYGHDHAVKQAYAHLDELLRQHQVVDVVVVQTGAIDQATEQALREAGGELWYCGPTLLPPGGGWSPVHADRYLLTACWGALAGKVLVALEELLTARRRAHA